MVVQPPIPKAKAEAILGSHIPPEGWARICDAFRQYGFHCEALKTTRLNRSKDPSKTGWYERQSAVSAAIESALKRVAKAQTHGDFLHEASENYSLETFGHSASGELNAHNLLREAYQKLSLALIVVERAQPREIETPTAATARDLLIREIRSALVENSVHARASDGRDLDQLGRAPRSSDLTPFENLIDAFGLLEEGQKASAFSAMIRAALAGGKGG